MSGINSKKIVWIVNYYNCPPEYVLHPRQLEFSHYLKQFGYEVINFSSGYLRDRNIDLVPGGKKYVEVSYGEYRFTHIKVRHYAGNGLARMLSLFQFAYRLLHYRNKFKKPDIILHSALIPFDYPVLRCAKKLGVKYIVEILDLWPESFVRFGLVSEKNPLLKLAYRIERNVYENASAIVFSFEGGIDYLRKQKWTTDKGGIIKLDKVFYINNGVNIHEFDKNVIENQINDPDLKDDKLFNVIYLGAIRMVNNVKTLIDAAKFLKFDTRIRFLIYGDGEERVFLEQYCENNNIKNVIFKEKWIPLKNVPYVVSKSSLNIMNYQTNFGLYGVSSGKLFQYLAAGKPICANIKINYCIISKNNLGIASELNSPEKYANAILSIVNMSKDAYDEMCSRVRKMAKEFDYEILTKKLVSIIENL